MVLYRELPPSLLPPHLRKMQKKQEDAMTTREELHQRLAEQPAPRVTAEQIEARITAVDYIYMRMLRSASDNDCGTICNIQLDNGFIVRGESNCVDPANYNRETGEKIAYDNAFAKLWPLFGFLLAEQQCRLKKQGE